MDTNERSQPKTLRKFQAEFSDCWRRLPNKAFFFALLAVWLMLFQFLGNATFGYINTPSLFRWMFNAYNSRVISDDDAQGNLIPFLVIGLFWWKRKELLELPLKIWLPALGFVVLGLALHVIGFIIQQPRVSTVALFIGIYGLMGLAWGRAWLRNSLFPFFLFIFSVPLGIVLEPITFPLRLLVCQLVEVVSHWILGIDVTRIGTQLIDPSGTYQYDVQAACSGIRSLVAIFLLATAYGFMMFRSPWKRLFLMVLAFPLSVLGNLVRMLCIIVAAEIGGQSAGDYVHEGGPLGIISLLPYIPAIFGLLLVGRWLEKKFVEKPQA
ncbi:MAG: exosortase/archaeosortase family protein [Verrucomicrobiota bacterium]|jgi:exosortase